MDPTHRPDLDLLLESSPIGASLRPRRMRRAFAVALLVLVPGCGKEVGRPLTFPPLSSVTVSPSADTLRVGESVSFVATAYDSAGVAVQGVPIDWSSSDPGVFGVDPAGKVSAVGEGSASLFVAADGVRDTASIEVMAAQNGWFAQISNANGANLNGVFFQPDARTGWAVGDAGKILVTRDAGASWALQVSGTAFSLGGVWFPAAEEGWTVGASGTVLYTQDGGDHWSRVGAGASETLTDVFFATRHSGWAVGSAGAVLRTTDRGATWQRTHPTAATLRSVAFADSLDGWAVGDGGVILGTHDGGAIWFVVQPSVTAQSLNAVWRRSDSLAFAAGDQGVTPRTGSGLDSTVWRLENAGAANQLMGVSFPTDAIGWAVGITGTGVVLRTQDGGRTWQPQVSNSQYGLNDVFFRDDRRGWAVGNNGTIIHTTTGGVP